MKLNRRQFVAGSAAATAALALPLAAVGENLDGVSLVGAPHPVNPIRSFSYNMTGRTFYTLNEVGIFEISPESIEILELPAHQLEAKPSRGLCVKLA